MGEGKPRDIKERSFVFAVGIVRLCRRLEKESDVYRTLGRQLLRSGTSVGANVEEAQAGQSRADFVSKYAIALKESRETKYWLRLLTESDPSLNHACAHLMQESDEIARVIASIIIKTKEASR
ncbi:MAG: four helix bundle protein [Armatimonadetes bacterium]|nr:four helix bundle protein [Armatimonadota bacterium]